MTTQKGVGKNTQPENKILENIHKMNDSFFLKITNMVKPTLYMNGHCKVTLLCGSKIEDGHQHRT